MAKLIIRPDAVGRYSSDWESNNANPYWANLNEINSDGDTAYVYTSDLGVFTVSFSDTSFGAYIEPTRVVSATLVATVRVNGGLPTKFKFRCRHLGVDYDSEEYTIVSNSYIEVNKTYRQTPGGVGWNATSLNSAEFGLVYVEGSELRCTKLEVQIHTELVPNQILLPDGLNPSFQDWHDFPGTASAHGSVQAYDGGLTYIYSSTLWEDLSLATTSDLWSVHGFDSSSVWAVGLDGTILRWDGTKWNVEESGTVESLLGVWGTSVSDLYAVGTAGTILYWDGVNWNAVASSTTNRLYGVWGSSSTDIFAVGINGTAVHYDGVSWSTMATGVTEDLLAVWGFGPASVFAVGTNGTIIYYNGAIWSPLISGTAATLRGVWGSALNDVYAVGDSGTIRYWDGFTWNPVSSGTSQTLRGIYGASSTDIVAVGNGGTVILWDGTSWEEKPTYRTDDYIAVWGTLATNIFVVGEGGKSIIYREVAWEPLSIFTASQFHAPAYPPVIDRVQLTALVLNVGETEGVAAVVARSVGTNYLGAHSQNGWVIPADGKWHLIEEEFLNDPSTGWPSGSPGSTPWSSAEVDLLEIGIKNLGGNLRCTTLAIECFQKHPPVSTFNMFPVSDGYYQEYNLIVPPQPPGSDWQNVDEDPPDYGTTYLGGSAAGADSNQYGSFGIGPGIGAFPAGTQAYALEVRCTMALGGTTDAVVAPVIRSNNETYFGRSFHIDNTGASWFDIKQDFFTSPYTGAPWTAAEIDAAEYGMVVLEGEALLNRLRVQAQTAPLLSGVPGANDLQLMDEAVSLTGWVTRSKTEGIIYYINEFAVGVGGYNSIVPTTVLPVNTMDTGLAGEVYRGKIENITYNTDVSPWEVTYWCRVPQHVALEGIGEIGLFGEVLWSPIPAEIGTKFILALMHMPCQCRHERTVHFYQLTIKYP